MKTGLGGTRRVTEKTTSRRPVTMLYAGLDPARKRLDYELLADDGEGAGGRLPP
jgi:hypothetical protein